VKPIPYRHTVDLVIGETVLDVGYGIASWLAVEGRLALRVVDLTPTYAELDGTPKSVPNDIHHHDETLVGPTDPSLLFRVGAKSGAFVTAARFGFTFPLGKTVENPYALGEQGISHEHTQFGTGTIVPVVGGGLSYVAERVELSWSALAFFSLYENAKGFRAPSRWQTGLRTTVPLFDGALRPFVTVDLTHGGRELWNGAPGLEGSFQQTSVLGGGGLAWRFADPWSVELGARAVLARASDGASFEYPAVFDVAVFTHVGP
jgi:hypothetical protein